MSGAQPTLASLDAPARHRVARMCREFRDLVESGERVDLPAFLRDVSGDEQSGDEQAVLLRELLQIEFDWQSSQGLEPNPDSLSELPEDLRSIARSVFAERLATLVPGERPAAAAPTVGPGTGDTQVERGRDPGWASPTLAPGEIADVTRGAPTARQTGAARQTLADQTDASETLHETSL
jgi:hypothetical protein